MKPPILALRVSRRAIGASVLRDDKLSFADGRHLRSQKDAAVHAASRYLERLLDLTKPATVVLDAPRAAGGTTEAIVHAFQSLLASRQLATVAISAAELLSAFGLPPLASRTELRQVVAPLFAELEALTGKVKPFVVEACAGALLMETDVALGRAVP